jgi:hypothetical protein
MVTGEDEYTDEDEDEDYSKRKKKKKKTKKMVSSKKVLALSG